MYTLAVFIIIFLYLALFVLLLLFIYSFSSLLFTDAPFVSSNRNSVYTLGKILDLKDGSTFYDLGCGDGRILLCAVKNNKNIHAFGIEKNLIAFCISKYNTRQYKNIKIIYGDFMHINYKNAHCIYAYLGDNIISILFDKLKKECTVGTKIITCDFVPKDTQPLQTLRIEQNKNLGKYIYVFEL